MPEMALYLKWRPQTFRDVVGQEHITRTLLNSLKRDRIRHAYLFSGPRGTGKTTNARLLAKAVNCLSDGEVKPCNACDACLAINQARYLDLIEIDAASHTGVDDVRELREKIAFAPGEGAYKVYIIDEVHRFSGNAFDALLKTLEEPPAHAIFVLATTEIDKVPATIKSRCLHFEFRRVSQREVSDLLRHIAEVETFNIESAALDLIARQGGGSVRDSISLLDQIVAEPEEAITLEMAQRLLGTASSIHVRELAAALAREELPRGLKIINDAIDSGSDPQHFGQQLVEYLRHVMLAQTASSDLVEASADERAAFDELAGAFSRPRLLKTIRSFNAAVNDYTGGWQPQLELELALIESLEADAPMQAAPMPATATQQPATQQPAAQPSEAYERATGSAPGEKAAMAADPIRQGWLDILRRVHQYNRNLPALLDHAQVLAIEGNKLILGVESPFFQKRISEADRAAVVERAIFDLHSVKLRLEVQVINGMARAPESAASSPLSDDPLVAAAKTLGGVLDDSLGS